MQAAADALEGKPLFLVEVKVSADNDIEVVIESENEGVTLDDCVEISRFIESRLDRDIEDFSLTVGYAGLTAPFKVLRQWQRAIGQEVQVTRANGSRVKGVLETASETEFSILYSKIGKNEAGKKETQEFRETFTYDEAKSVKPVIKF